MKPHIRSFLLGIGLALGAVLLTGQMRPAAVQEPGRYRIEPRPQGDGVWIVDTATGAVKVLLPRAAGERPLYGVPFDRLP